VRLNLAVLHPHQRHWRQLPRVKAVGPRPTLTFIDGEFTQPGPWTLEGAAALGVMLRDLHRATRSFRPPPDAVWFPWHGRDQGGPDKVIGHCDVAPWNIVARHGLPVALIDWETGGPVSSPRSPTATAWMLRHRRTLEAALTRGSP
jgi:hypothetical protein